MFNAHAQPSNWGSLSASMVGFLVCPLTMQDFGKKVLKKWDFWLWDFMGCYNSYPKTLNNIISTVWEVEAQLYGLVGLNTWLL